MLDDYIFTPFSIVNAPDPNELCLISVPDVKGYDTDQVESLEPGWDSLIPEVLKASVTENEDIVVVGTRVFRLDFPDYPQATVGNSDWSEFVSGAGGGIGESPPDNQVMDITINISRPLTASETAALEALKATIGAITAAIGALADNAKVTLPNGADVTGAELKAIWAITDFVINDSPETGSNYANGGGGEANMFWGNPTISFDIEYLDGYADLPGGMNYVVAHELGHLSQAGTSHYTDQRVANDIARALLNGAGLAYLPNPGFEYSPTAPMQFSVPSTSTGGTGSGNGTGYTGGTGNDPKTIEP
jgi:hypothetical protein